MNKNGFVESFLWPICMWLTHGFVALLLSVVLIGIVPKFVMQFEEFSMELPQATQMLIGLSHMMCSYWYLLVPFLAIVDAAALLGLSQLPPKLRWLRSLWFNFFMLAAIVFLFLTLFVLIVPFQQTVHGLS